MCGRYVLDKPDKIKVRFKIERKLPLFEPNYNIAPGMIVPVVFKSEQYKCELMEWGFVPDWSTETKYKAINAREEKLEEGFYKLAFLHKRCLIPASGFYEWRRIIDNDKEIKTPYFIRLKQEELFGLAGIYSEKGFAIITTKPNSVMMRIHDRMPVIINKENEEKWLSGESELSEIKHLIQSIESEKMTGWRVGREVNDPKNNNQELIRKIN